MKLNLLMIIFWGSLCLQLAAHGRSEEMKNELNAPVPAWMNLAVPIKVNPEKDANVEPLVFRQVSQGVTYTRNRVLIPDRSIDFKVDYPISRYQGASMSPDGLQLLVNSGTTPHLYDITPKGDLIKKTVQLPYITYDKGDKGFISGWSWAGNNVLIGRSSITDETGHIDMEIRLYAYFLKDKLLARLDLKSLNLSKEEIPEILSIGDNLQHLRLRAGDREFLVKADLKSPPKTLSESSSETTKNHVDSNQTNSLKPFISWLIIGGIFLVILTFGVIMMKRKQR